MFCLLYIESLRKRLLVFLLAASELSSCTIVLYFYLLWLFCLYTEKSTSSKMVAAVCYRSAIFSTCVQWSENLGEPPFCLILCQKIKNFCLSPLVLFEHLSIIQKGSINILHHVNFIVVLDCLLLLSYI